MSSLHVDRTETSGRSHSPPYRFRDPALDLPQSLFDALLQVSDSQIAPTDDADRQPETDIFHSDAGEPETATDRRQEAEDHEPSQIPSPPHIDPQLLIPLQNNPQGVQTESNTPTDLEPRQARLARGEGESGRPESVLLERRPTDHQPDNSRLPTESRVSQKSLERETRDPRIEKPTTIPSVSLSRTHTAVGRNRNRTNTEVASSVGDQSTKERIVLKDAQSPKAAPNPTPGPRQSASNESRLEKVVTNAGEPTTNRRAERLDRNKRNEPVLSAGADGQKPFDLVHPADSVREGQERAIRTPRQDIAPPQDLATQPPPSDASRMGSGLDRLLLNAPVQGLISQALRSTQPASQTGSLGSTQARIGAGPIPSTVSMVHSTRPATTSTTSGYSPITPRQEVKLVQRVMRGFEQLANGENRVQLRLHPPHLGSLQMTLRMESSNLTARLEVQSQAAHDAIVQNLNQLTDRLEQQGVRVERFEVQIQSPADLANLGAPESDNSATDERTGQEGRSDDSPPRDRASSPGAWRNSRMDNAAASNLYSPAGAPHPTRSQGQAWSNNLDLRI